MTTSRSSYRRGIDWTPEQDAYLERLFRQHGKHPDFSVYREVSALMMRDGHVRTKEAVRKRFEKLYQGKARVWVKKDREVRHTRAQDIISRMSDPERLALHKRWGYGQAE